MTDKELVLSTLRKAGKLAAQSLQERAPEMTGTEVVAEGDFLPNFDPKRQYLNYKTGYVCMNLWITRCTAVFIAILVIISSNSKGNIMLLR